MSHSEFLAALARINFSAGVLAAQGSQYTALYETTLLAERLEQHVAIATPLPFSPLSSPISEQGGLCTAWEPASPPQIATQQYRFATPHSFTNPPQPPSLYDTYRKDRVLMHTLPKGAPDVPASMYPSKRTAAAVRTNARKPSAPDAG